MIFSAILAFFIPFQLFLFSYAVLGPLHYLTEIAWLNERHYFTKSKFDFLLLLAGGIVLFGMNLFEGNHFIPLAASIMFFAFFSSLIMVTVKSVPARTALFLFTALVSLLVKGSSIIFALFAILLPTIIHVFFFTGCFILYGALRSKSRAGFLSVLVFIACFLILFFLTVDVHTLTLSSYVADAYKSFESVNLEIMNLLNINNPNVQYAIYASAAGLSIMRFIAFAYTYHYLNWFSKTKVIRWHEVPKRELQSIFVIWIASVVLYIYNYSLGLFALFFLSLLHVLLEFPLDHNTFIGIYKETKKLVTRNANI